MKVGGASPSPTFRSPTHPLQESGLYEYKTLGLMDDLDSETCAQVYVDWEYRKVWDSYVLGKSLAAYTHTHTHSGQVCYNPATIYFKIRFPFSQACCLHCSVTIR